MNERESLLLEKYQVRKTKDQKSGFIEFAIKESERLGYFAKVETAKRGARNIIVGKPEKAKVIFTAHYDTAPRLPLPNFITPMNIPIYILYQILLVAVILAPSIILYGVLLGFDAEISSFLGMEEWLYSLLTLLIFYAMLFITLKMLLVGPANKHTANDNTSGVAVLFRIMELLPEEHRDSVAFVFFDMEEVGLVGSAAFSKARGGLPSKPVINFDCVSDGDNFVFALKKGARRYKDALISAYATEEPKRLYVLERGVFYPSDQMMFKRGVGVCALKGKKKRLLYLNRIHTGRDVIFSEENLDYFANGSVRLLYILREAE